MGKALVRFTIITTGVYMAVAYILAMWAGIDILGDWYIVLFELICVVYCYSEGKYHCRYLKHLALGLLASEVITRLDNAFDFMSISAHNLLPLSIIGVSFIVSTTLAIRHFYKVQQIKKGTYIRNNTKIIK